MKKLILLVGTSMHGKSTLADIVASRLGAIEVGAGSAPVWDVDEVRLESFPDWKKEAANKDGSHNFPVDIHYLTLATDKMMEEAARTLCNSGTGVIVGTFSQPGTRRIVYDFQKNNPDVDVKIIRLNGTLTPKQVKKRIKERRERGDDSPMQNHEAYQKSVRFQEEAWEGPQLSPWTEAQSVDMNKFDGNIDGTVDEIMRLSS